MISYIFKFSLQPIFTLSFMKQNLKIEQYTKIYRLFAY